MKNELNELIGNTASEESTDTLTTMNVKVSYAEKSEIDIAFKCQSAIDSKPFFFRLLMKKGLETWKKEVTKK